MEKSANNTEQSTLLGANESINKYYILKKQILVSAIKTFHKCQKNCYKDLFNLNQNCLYKCEFKLNNFNEIKKNKFSDFLFKFDTMKMNMDNLVIIDIERNLAITEFRAVQHLKEMKEMIGKWDKEIEKGLFLDNYKGFNLK